MDGLFYITHDNSITYVIFCYSDLFDSVSTMAPNSEDSSRLDRYNLIEENNAKVNEMSCYFNYIEFVRLFRSLLDGNS